MTTFYIDPSAPGTGDGLLANPFRSWTSVSWAPGNTYLQKRGTTYVGNNDCSGNMNFGIHVTGVAKSVLIEGNTCSYNGGTASPNYYGRGIELSSAATRTAIRTPAATRSRPT